MTIEPGARLGSYEVVDLLAKGGMGEVYRAIDHDLDREVALKVLPAEVARDPERLQRFEREAKVLAALNHPHVATVHGFSSHAGIHFLAMELVEGPTLADRLDRGAMPVEEALTVFLQIADGLEVAHRKGIVHRDLKPANIKITRDGTVKILDFGLAKALAQESQADDGGESNSPTLTLAATQRGEILGTAAYMSPEQARGLPVDQQADVWAFGVCLFESLTGRRAFAGRDATETLAAVLRDGVEWDALPKATPTALERLLRRCLERDPGRRLRHIGDARLELGDALDEPRDDPPSTTAGTAPSLRRLALPWALSLALGGLIAGFAGFGLKPATPRPLVRSTLSVAPSAALSVAYTRSDLAVTPDGRAVIYRTRGGLYVRPIGELEGRLLADTEGAIVPFVSPNGEWVGFEEDAELKKAPLEGGRPERICELPLPITGASWGKNGTIVFAAYDGFLYRVPARGGDPEWVAGRDRDSVGTAARREFTAPKLLPGDRSVLFGFREGPAPGDSGIAVLDLDNGKRKVLLTSAGGGGASYVPTGHLVYGHGRTLHAVAFDLEALEVRSDPVPVLQGLITKTTGATDFAISSDGSLVYVSSGSGISQSRLVWVDRDGHEEPLEAPPGDYQYPRISADGERVAVTNPSQDYDVWIWDLGRNTLSRLTSNPSQDIYSVWSRRDGRDEVIYSSQAAGLAPDLYRKAADGTGAAERLTESHEGLFPSSLSPDGRYLVCRVGRNAPLVDLGVIDLEGSSEPQPLLATEEFAELNGEISPDGRFLAYQSDQSGSWEIYVRPFPDVNAAQWQISSGGGREPLWSPDGRELFYRGQGEMMRVPVQTNRGFEPGTAQALFADSYTALIGRNYDISPGGDRFLMVKQTTGNEEGVALPQVVLVQNWLDELERLVPTN